MGLTSTRELHAEPVVPNTSESKQNLFEQIQFPTKVMVKQTRQEPNNISISKINIFIIQLSDYIHSNTYLVTSNKSNTRSITHLCLPFLKENIDNSHLLIQTCWINSRCWSKQRTVRRGTLCTGAILLLTPPSTYSEKSPWRFLHKNKRSSRWKIFFSSIKTRLQGSQTGSSRTYKTVMASRHRPSIPSKRSEPSKEECFIGGVPSHPMLPSRASP